MRQLRLIAALSCTLCMGPSLSAEIVSVPVGGLAASPQPRQPRPTKPNKPNANRMKVDGSGT